MCEGDWWRRGGTDQAVDAARPSLLTVGPYQPSGLCALSHLCDNDYTLLYAVTVEADQARSREERENRSVSDSWSSTAVTGEHRKGTVQCSMA